MTTTRIVMVAAVALCASATGAEAQYWGGGRTPREGACFYKDANFRGAYFCMEAGDEFDRMPSSSDDEVSSIRIYGRAEVVVYEDRRFRGGSKSFTRNVSNLEREGINDEISSVQVMGRSYSGGGRPGAGFGQNPDRVITRAYQDLLDRDPDPAGLRQYRRRMIDDGWTEAQVRDAIRNSPEYRQKSVMTPARAQEVVARAYQNVLRRDPDPGSRTYVQRVLRDGWTQQDVERELRKSDEYRNRPR